MPPFILNRRARPDVGWEILKLVSDYNGIPVYTFEILCYSIEDAYVLIEKFKEEKL